MSIELLTGLPLNKPVLYDNFTEAAETPEEDLTPVEQPPVDNSFYMLTLEELEAPNKKQVAELLSYFGHNVSHMAGHLCVDVEAAKHKDVGHYIDLKEKSVKEVEKIHDFLTAMKSCIDEKNNTIQMDKEPYRTYVDEMRATFGDKLFPVGVYSVKGKDQIEGLRESLFNCIQDRMSHVNIYDMRIANILEEIKQMLDALRKIAEMEQHSIDKIIRNSSRVAG